MKKLITIILTITLLISSVLCFGSFAATSRTEEIIGKMNETKSIGITVPDGELDFGNIKVTNVNLAAKIFTDANGKNELKIAGSGKVFGMKAKLVIDNSGFFAFIPGLRLKIRLSDILGFDLNTDALSDDVVLVFETLPKVMRYLELSKCENKNVEGYGKVDFEVFKPDVTAIAKEAVNDGVITLPDGVTLEQITEENLLLLAGENADRVKTMLESYAEFYYRDGTLVGFKIYLSDLDGASQTFTSADVFPVKVSEIKTDIADDVFSVSGFFIDITFLVKFIVGLFISK